MKTSLALASYITAVLAQTPSLTDLLASQSDLSNLGAALGSVPDLAKTLAGLSDITILAPTDNAFAALLSKGASPEGDAVKSNDTQAIAAILAYHVLNGTYVSSDFKDTPAFVHSLFTPSFEGSLRTNVTGGQNVGLVLDGKNANILSGGLSSAIVTEAVSKLSTETYTSRANIIRTSKRPTTSPFTRSILSSQFRSTAPLPYRVSPTSS